MFSAVEATKNDIGQKYQADCQKYIDLMKLPEYGLQKAAEYLEHWFAGTWPRKPLLDLSGNHGCIVHDDAIFFDII